MSVVRFFCGKGSFEEAFAESPPDAIAVLIQKRISGQRSVFLECWDVIPKELACILLVNHANDYPDDVSALMAKNPHKFARIGAYLFARQTIFNIWHFVYGTTPEHWVFDNMRFNPQAERFAPNNGVDFRVYLEYANVMSKLGNVLPRCSRHPYMTARSSAIWRATARHLRSPYTIREQIKQPYAHSQIPVLYQTDGWAKNLAKRINNARGVPTEHWTTDCSLSGKYIVLSSLRPTYKQGNPVFINLRSNKYFSRTLYHGCTVIESASPVFARVFENTLDYSMGEMELYKLETAGLNSYRELAKQTMHRAILVV